MANEGVYPIDPASAVGQFRVLAGDSNPVEVLGGDRAEFRLWSDAEIEVYLSLSPDNVFRAVADGCWALASAAAAEAKVVKDYDLQVDLAKRARELRETATRMGERADKLEFSGEHFVHIPGDDVDVVVNPEAAPHVRLW